MIAESTRTDTQQNTADHSRTDDWKQAGRLWLMLVTVNECQGQQRDLPWPLQHTLKKTRRTGLAMDWTWPFLSRCSNAVKRCQDRGDSYKEKLLLGSFSSGQAAQRNTDGPGAGEECGVLHLDPKAAGRETRWAWLGLLSPQKPVTHFLQQGHAHSKEDALPHIATP